MWRNPLRALIRIGTSAGSGTPAWSTAGGRTRTGSAIAIATAGGRVRGIVAIGAALLVGGTAGCAHGGVESEVRDLRARLEASEQARAELARKLEDLDNRVFLLTDQVESQKLALARHGGEPRLPVVTLTPAAEREPTVEGDAGAAGASRGITIGPAAGTTDVGSERDGGMGAATLDPPRTISPGSNEARPRLTLSGGSVPWIADRAGPEKPERRTRTDRDAPTSARRARRPPPAAAAGARSPDARAATGPGGGVYTAGDTTTAANASGDEPTAVYRAAYGKLKAGRPEQAADELRAFVQRFPQHDLADNAQYWLGETYYARAAYREAIVEFRSVVRRWPAGNKVPDALLKLGFCHLALGQTAEARAALAEVVDHYPRTEAAQLAGKRLSELPTESKK